MPYHDWIDASVFNWFIFTFHVGGLSDIVAQFYKKHYTQSYKEFYTVLLQDLEQQHWYQQWRDEIVCTLDEWLHNGRLTNLVVGEVKIHGWLVQSLTRIKFAHDPGMLEPWHDFLTKWLAASDLPTALQQDLARLQRQQLISLHNRSQFPQQVTLSWNIWPYIMNTAPLCNVANHLELTFPENTNTSDREFLERIHYGRRRRYGRAWIKQVL
jgi:hypothetical protein